MKKLAILAMSLTICIFADEIDELVKKIKQERVSHIDKKKIKALKSPIPKIIVEKNTSKEINSTIVQNIAPEFVLKAIMNNRAFINDKWVKKGDNIGNYKVVEILEDAVYLSNGKKNKMIFFNKKNGKIIFRKVSK